LTTGLFQPHFEWSWLWLWAICILGQIPTGAWRDWLVGLISVKVGVIIKRRLMAGALALTPEEMRLEGIGSLLGRVIESEALESMSLAGGLMAVLSLIEIGTAAPVFLAAGPPGGRLLLLLAGYGVGMGGLLAWWLGRTRQRWVQHRLAMAQALVERLVGHRTRLAQESGSWHTEEDRLLADYFTFSRQMDRPAAFLSAALERGWLCLALLVIALGALLFDFDQGSGGTSLEQLGLLLGGTLLVYYPLQNLPGAIANLVAARVAFDQIAPIWKAATPTRGPAHSPDPKAARAFYFSLPQLPGAEVEAGVEAAAAAAAEKETSPASASAYALAPAPELARPGSGSGSGNEFNSLQSAATATGESARARARARSFGVVLEAHNLSYAYPARGETTLTVLNGCELQIKAGDQLLLQGASGGGKSTLIALLAGLRKPSAGTLLLGGLDLPTVGEQIWRKRVAVAPQFHENYVVTESLAFNLLLGRAWPPSEQDLAEALAVCQDLGLGDLLAKMPMGLFQIVGESGWQLSHGEKSRLFIARALLEGADLTILDESFAALDPQTLRAAMEGVRKRARTLLVVAHP
jgi:ATP-binding cassette subfamily B protein